MCILKIVFGLNLQTKCDNGFIEEGKTKTDILQIVIYDILLEHTQNE